MIDWMLTKSGVEFQLNEPTKNMINITDIAFSLARIRRFNGHTKANCSVALHSVIVSHLVHPNYAANALLHDAHEAYTGDILTPVKNLLKPGIKLLERKLDRVIRERFGLNDPHDIERKQIEYADLSALLYERIHFMASSRNWGCFEDISPAVVPNDLRQFYKIEDPEYHELLFLKRVKEIGLTY